MKKAELVFIPCPARGHLPTALEFAKLLLSRTQKLSITVLLIKIPFDPTLDAYNDSLVASFSSDQINFVDVSLNPNAVIDIAAETTNPMIVNERFISSHRCRVRNALVSPDGATPRPGLAGFVLDMTCTSMAEVARELGVPTYIFWAASAASLGLHLHVQIKTENHESIDLDSDHSIPGFTKPVPGRLFPTALFNEAAPAFLVPAKKIRQSRGVVINTSAEIEPYALKALFSDESSPPPKVYAVGPILHVPEENGEEAEEIKAWLDSKSPASVLFVCFGSLGILRVEQIREIAAAIESAGVRFLWSLRQFRDDPDKILPEGFLERTAEKGRVVGWAPQTAVLAHPAVGGFVSHCGWNSILESLFHGVPIATWPLFAEQNINAFKMVVELGLAVEVNMDFKFGFAEENDGIAASLVGAEVIEAAMRKVMEEDSEIKKKVKEMSVKCRNDVVHGGSSFSSLDRFVCDIFENLDVSVGL